MKSDAEYREILRSAGLIIAGLPEGIEETQYVSARDDWYMKLAGRWYWYDVRAKSAPCWKYTPLSPLYDSAQLGR